MKLTHDQPSSEGVRNGLKRAKRLVEAVYTPVAPFPLVNYYYHADGTKTYDENYTSAWLPRKGMPYSSVRRFETYIGMNISFETFYSALTNPDSVVYTKPITGSNQNVHNHYGIVCSCFVSEVLDLPYRTPCIRIPNIEGVREIPQEPLEGLRLLDILLNVKKHVAIITGIERDEDGIVRYITVSESVLPLCRSTRFSTEDFRHYWYDNDFLIYRYDGADRITYTPDPFLPLPEDGPLPEAKINRVLMPDYGNKANYRLGEEVLVSVFKEGFDRLKLEAPDGTVSFAEVTEGKCTLRPGMPGFYKVYALCGETESDSVEFCVTDLLFTTDKPLYGPGETIRLHYRNSAGDPVIAWQFNKITNDRGCGGWHIKLPEAEGDLELTCPSVEEPVQLYLMARNAYGIYTSDRIQLKESCVLEQ